MEAHRLTRETLPAAILPKTFICPTPQTLVCVSVCVCLFTSRQVDVNYLIRRGVSPIPVVIALRHCIESCVQVSGVRIVTTIILIILKS